MTGIPVDLYATKGIEYLIVIAYFMVVVGFWMVLRPASGKSLLSARVGEGLAMPHGLFFDPAHTWSFLAKNGEVTMGVDEFIPRVTGPLNKLELRSSGDNVMRGDLIATMKGGAGDVKLYAPVSGEIMSVNRKLSRNPEQLQKSSYLDGWLYKIKPANWALESSRMMLGDVAKNWMEREFTNLREFFALTLRKYDAQPAMVTLQDGGLPIEGALKDLPPEIWVEFQGEFVDSVKPTPQSNG